MTEPARKLSYSFAEYLEQEQVILSIGCEFAVDAVYANPLDLK